MDATTAASDNVHILVSASITSWNQNIQEKDFSNARIVLRESIQTLLELQKAHTLKDEKTLTIIYIALHTLKAILDFTILIFLTENQDRLNENKIIELCWEKLWDTKERLEMISPYIKIDNTIVRMIISLFKALDKWYYKGFGPGMYSSPEIYVSSSNCSVCGKEIKKCVHIPGIIYSGVRCYSKPNDMSVKNVSIVFCAKDPRCRIWPWQLKEEDGTNTIVGMRVMSISGIENFEEDDEAWKKLIPQKNG